MARGWGWWELVGMMAAGRIEGRREKTGMKRETGISEWVRVRGFCLFSGGGGWGLVGGSLNSFGMKGFWGRFRGDLFPVPEPAPKPFPWLVYLHS